MGLEFAIVKHMGQQISGSLSIDSRGRVGTRVTVRLPKIEDLLSGD